MTNKKVSDYRQYKKHVVDMIVGKMQRNNYDLEKQYFSSSNGLEVY